MSSYDFQSVLRILDCFLLEGSKVLYRVALGLLKVNARRMLSITDPVGLFQMLKEIAKHSFDIDHLLKVPRLFCPCSTVQLIMSAGGIL